MPEAARPAAVPPTAAEASRRGTAPLGSRGRPVVPLPRSLATGRVRADAVLLWTGREGPGFPRRVRSPPAPRALPTARASAEQPLCGLRIRERRSGNRGSPLRRRARESAVRCLNPDFVIYNKIRKIIVLISKRCFKSDRGFVKTHTHTRTHARAHTHTCTF